MEIQKAKSETKVRKGKQSRAQGNAFEARVRDDLEEKGFICDKWSNNVEFSEWVEQEDTGKTFIDKVDGIVEMRGKLVKAKPKYLFINGGMRMVGNNSGFPDFITFKPGEVGPIVGVESKMTGELDRPEKEKCDWLLRNKIFSKILIASKHKIKNRIHIEYEDFKIKYYRFYDAK